MNRFPMIEMAVKELVGQRYPAASGRIGGELSYAYGQGLHVWIGLVPGGSSTVLEGEWIVDIDTFADDYATAMQASLDIEAALLYPSYAKTSTMRIDSIAQNESPSERPWNDDTVFRVGATYVFTARRSG